MDNVLPVLIANAPEALIELCGVNLLERLLRILQRLGFRRAVVFSTTPDIVGAELARRSSTRRNKTITSSACVGMCGHCPSECRWSRTVVWPSVLFSIRRKREHSTCRLIYMRQSKPE